MVRPPLPTLYQCHVHPTHKNNRPPPPTYGMACIFCYCPSGPTKTPQTQANTNNVNMDGYTGPHGPLAGTRRSTGTTHAETNWQTPQSCPQIRILLQTGQTMANRAHSSRHATTTNSGNTTCAEPLCRGPVIRRGQLSALDTETRAALHMEHISTHIRRIHQVPAGAQEQIGRTRRGTSTPLETLA